jgi:hypothetical protein
MPSSAGGTRWSSSGWQSKQWKGRHNGAWEEDRWAQWTGWQGKWTGSCWDADSWKADPPPDSPEGRDGGGVSEDERANKEQEEPFSWEHCVATWEPAEDAQPPPDNRHPEPTAGSPPHADELRALHEAVLMQFLRSDEGLTGADAEDVPFAAPPEVAALTATTSCRNDTEDEACFAERCTAGVMWKSYCAKRGCELNGKFVVLCDEHIGTHRCRCCGQSAKREFPYCLPVRPVSLSHGDDVFDPADIQPRGTGRESEPSSADPVVVLSPEAHACVMSGVEMCREHLQQVEVLLRTAGPGRRAWTSTGDNN